MMLKGTTFEAEFSVQLNNFTVLVNNISGDNYCKITPKVPLIKLFAVNRKTKERVELKPGAGVLSGNQTHQAVTYSRFGGEPVEVVLSLQAVEDCLIISAEVTNNSEALDITEILCPHLSGIALGSSTADDKIIYPHHGGERTVNPVEVYASERTRGFWRANSIEADGLFRREINYCGLASMSWMYYYDDKNGLYMGSHDPRFPVTGVIAETGGAADPQMGFGFRKYHRIAKGESYCTGEYCIAVTEKDWHYGAQLYRQYIVPHLDLDHTPEFLRDECALNQCYNFKRGGVVENRFVDIPRMFDAGREFGVRHMFIASWNRTGFDSFYPEYYPDMELGSAMEFRRGLEYIRGNGGFSTLYINARIFDLKSDFHKSMGERMALRDYNGNMVYESYGPENFTVNCPSDALWYDYLLDTAEFAVKAYGCDGIYLDQLASAEPFACYCDTHSHGNIGEFNNGYICLLRELLKRLKAHNPNAYIMTENFGDIYGSFTWGNLTWNGADYDEYYNVLRYTFPEFVQVNMVNPRGWLEDAADKYVWFFRDMHRAILLGNVLWMGITTRMKPSDGEFHTASKQYLAFRERLQPYLKNAGFEDDAWLIDSIGECRASCWTLAGGKRMIICANSSTVADGSLTITLPRECKRYHRFETNWKQTTAIPIGERLKVDVLPKQLCCILME